MVKEETGRGYKAPCPVFSFVENTDVKKISMILRKFALLNFETNLTCVFRKSLSSLMVLK